MAPPILCNPSLVLFGYAYSLCKPSLALCLGLFGPLPGSIQYPKKIETDPALVD